MFPFKINKENKNKIYVKHFIYLVSLMELNKNHSNFNIKLKKNNFIFKKNFKKTQILRSPNRHKIAQFHVSRKNFILISSIDLLISSLKINVVFLIKFLKKILISFESSSIFVKNIKINYSTNLFLNKINFCITWLKD